MTSAGGSAVAVVTELVRRFHAGDIDGAFALYRPDLRIEQPSSLPHGGVHHGPEGARGMAAAFGRHWDRTVADARLLDGGDTTVQVTTQTWTAKPTGRSATVEVVELFSVAHGLVARIRVFPQDTHLLLATLDPA
jgi:ketosteroid isomerase-like protein